MFKRPACLQSRQRNGGEDWSTFPVRQLFVLGKSVLLLLQELCGLVCLASLRICFFSLSYQMKYRAKKGPESEDKVSCNMSLTI